MKKAKRICGILAGGVVACGIALGMAGCGNGNIKIDNTKTQLYVFSYNGGVGNEWLDHTIESFEAEYADVSFEEGKTGVQVIPDKQKDAGTSMVDSFKNKNIDVVFNETVRYNEWVTKGNLKDITDVVVGGNELDGGKKIADKLPDDKKAALTAKDGKYYALPHYEAFRGVVYDVDLFRQKKLFFAADRTVDDFIISDTSVKSAGPDGKTGTYDDGLPATYTEFWQLCDKMTANNVIPFIWSGEEETYSEFLLYALSETMAGAAEAKLNYSFGHGIESDAEKTAKIVTGFNGNEPVVEDKVISEENGYLMRQTESKYRALEFLFRIFNTDNYYHKDSIGKLTMSNTEAQQTFIFSSLENKPIGMLIEGTFWETEAKDSMELAVQSYGERARNRNFGWMPLPGVYDGEVNETNGKKQVYSDYINAYCGISSNCSGVRLELAKKFIKYCYSDAGLNEFTKYTGMRRGVNYQLNPDTTANLSSFYKSVLAARKEADVITPMSASPLFMANENTFTLYNYVWNSKNYTFPVSAYRGKMTSARTYFEGMKLTESDWAKKKYTVS